MYTHQKGHRPAWRHAVIAAVIGVASTLVVAGPANATIYERFQYEGEDYAAFPYCGLEEVQVDVQFSGRGHIRAGKGKTAGAFYIHDNSSAVQTLTNPENGKFVTISSDAVFQDIKATRVDGSIFEFVSHEVGQPFVLRDMDGNVVLRDRGAITWTYLFDTGGDDVPGGERLEELDVRVSGPHPGFFIEEDDECALAMELIG